jgi:integrase
VKLTDLTLQKLKFDGTQKRIFDDGLPNFGVRTYQSGHRFIVLVGKERQSHTIGRYPEMSLKEARTAALRLLSDTNAPKSTKLSNEALDAFFTHCEGKNKPRTVRDYRRLLKSFPSGKIASIGRVELLDALTRLVHVPAERAHTTTAFQVFLNWCVHNGYLETNPIAGLRNQGTVRKRERVLTDEELRNIWTALDDSDFSNIIRILILTGLRRGEVAHISVTGNTLTIPAAYTKNKREHNIPIGEFTKQYARPIAFNGWGKSKARLDEASGVTDWTIHDLRRTFATAHQRLGTPVHITEKLLNHVSGTFSGVTGIYQRHTYLDEMRQAVLSYENWIKSNCLG